MNVNIFFLDCNCIFHSGDISSDFFQAQHGDGTKTQSMTATHFDKEDASEDEEEPKEASPQKQTKRLFGLCFQPHGVTII